MTTDTETPLVIQASDPEPSGLNRFFRFLGRLVLAFLKLIPVFIIIAALVAAAVTATASGQGAERTMPLRMMALASPMLSPDQSAYAAFFSPLSSLTTIRTRDPRAPTQAPTGSTLGSLDHTAIFVRCPGSRAHALISTVPSASCRRAPLPDT